MLFKLDAVLLSLATEAAVGRYGAAYRLLESTMFVGWAINGAFVAMYAYLGRDTDPTVGAVFGRSLKLALVLRAGRDDRWGSSPSRSRCWPSAATSRRAAEPLRLLAPVVVPLCLVTLCSSLIVTRQPAAMLRITGPMVALNVALNLALIPTLGQRGGRRDARDRGGVPGRGPAHRGREVGGVRWRSMALAALGAGASMAVVMLLLASLPLVAFAAGAATYAAVFLVIERSVSPGDLEFALGMLRRRLGSRAAA